MNSQQKLLTAGLAFAFASCVSTKIQELPPNHPASTNAPEAPPPRSNYSLGSDAESQRTKQLLSQAGQKTSVQPQRKLNEDQNNEPMPGMDMPGH
jgi:hypothetical protein